MPDRNPRLDAHAPGLLRRAALIAAVLLVAGPAPAENAPTPGDATLERVLERVMDQPVSVRLVSGVTLEGGTLVEVQRDARSDSPRRLRLRLASGRLRSVPIDQLGALLLEGEAVYTAPMPAAGRPPRRRLTRKQRELARAEEAARLADEERARWLVRLRARGVKPWPAVSDEEYRAATEANRTEVERVQAKAPGMQLFETDHFLFCTNIPPQQVAPFIRSLDEMHRWMCQTYGIDPAADRVWLGKTPVFAFLTKEQFLRFERETFQVNPTHAYGICHQQSSGKVTIACYRGQRPEDFGQMLVHETSHGFIHRYKTLQRLPSWVNEGMADHIGAVMVPRSKAVENRERAFLNRLRQQARSGRLPSVRASLFKPVGNIETDQYGPAAGLARFMLSTDGRAYVRFIELLKEGTPQEEALEKSFGGTLAELVAAYGRRIGVPALSIAQQ